MVENERIEKKRKCLDPRIATVSASNDSLESARVFLTNPQITDKRKRNSP